MYIKTLSNLYLKVNCIQYFHIGMVIKLTPLEVVNTLMEEDIKSFYENPEAAKLSLLNGFIGYAFFTLGDIAKVYLKVFPEQGDHIQIISEEEEGKILAEYKIERNKTKPLKLLKGGKD